ncbi:hypothetical protein OESDEN_20135 [Oesophagostomum dentatum]|uniref:Galactosylgalactosylxylosylprotein 3-beta-glucuronosyltransferase n=1 Tax=Oesophagostomum dentatum TaxID=61180 RepID=A0A0B1SAH3_OESDE|nr:hypothetical protein OESDEN_20135 [Oesophagostomum dentatum]
MTALSHSRVYARIPFRVRDRLSLVPAGRQNAPVIYFVTPTSFRPAQKADLTRLSYALAHVPNLYWIVVEDALTASGSIGRILKRSRLPHTHLSVKTPANMKMKHSDPSWYLPRGVPQRNAALAWIRTQLSRAKTGVVYFGDDDNTYDLRLFDEIRSVQVAGIWPVGIVGGLIVEKPLLAENGSVIGFNAVWKPERPFPIDMAAFAVNLTLVTANRDALFSYDVARGYQESHFLTSLGLTRSDLEPKAMNCTRVYVWHTRTEKSKLSKTDWARLSSPDKANVTKQFLESAMGERKGQNFYYPPDFDYKKHKSLNRYHGTHALRERAKKISQGILVIRFEMPFNIWCLGCNNHVGMGVRYNAEKKKIGMYYTTPLYEFRMKCHLCDNYFVIRTDPKNFDYELVEGCSRQEKRFEPSEIDQVDTADSSFSQKLAADAMFKTEHQEDDKSKATNDESRMEKIEWVQERLRDDFAANQALRSQFRKEKKELTEKRARDDDLRARCSLSIPLAPEDPNDKKVAGMLARYRTVKTYEERQEERRNEITAKRIFASTSKPSTSSVETPTPSSIERLKNNIRLDRNRRINSNFESGPAPKKSSLSLGIVRKSVKRELDDHELEEDIELTSNDTDVNDEKDVKDEKKEEDGLAKTGGLVADYDSSGSGSD